MSAPLIVQQNIISSGTVHNVNSQPSLTGVTGSSYLLAIIGFTPSSGNNALSFPIPTDSSGQTWPAALVSLPSLNSPDSSGAQAFGLAGAIAGTHTLTFNNSTPSAYNFAALFEISGVGGVDQAVGAQTPDHNSTTLAVTTGTLAQATELAIAFMTCFDTIGSTTNMGITDPPSGFTSIQAYQNESTNNPGQISSKTTAATTALSPSWAWTNGGAGSAIIVTFQGLVGPTAPIAWVS